MTTETPAQTITRAAQMLRVAASRATLGPYSTEQTSKSFGFSTDVWGPDTIVAATVAKADAAYIALMSPTVGLALAGWLDATAASFNEAAIILAHPWHDDTCNCLSHIEYHAALAVAEAILGGGA